MIDAAQWGVTTGYHDALGNWRDVPQGAVRQILQSMGVDPDGHGPPPPWAGPLVVRPDGQLPPGALLLESGEHFDIAQTGQHPTLPFGYHRFEPPDAPARRVVVSPGWCPAPPSAQWGWAVQLYATRSAQSWGIGDLADLGVLGDWSAALGAGLVLINPLHAAPPVGPQEPSPYFASSRCFSNPLYLRIEDLPGAHTLSQLGELAAQGRALNAQRRIDRDRVWALKAPALRALYERFEAEPPDLSGFERYCAARGATLQGYATWCALAERYGVPWQSWPAALRHPGLAGVAAFTATPDGQRSIRYHAWLQWHLDEQLASAARSTPVVQDLAIGVNAGGADAWLWQDQLAPAMRVGAPPDQFNTLGQDWGLPPWDPRKLAAADYEPFVQTIRGALRHAGGLRIDHVMGLFRLFWIPEGRPGAEGTYVAYPHRDLLDIVALEATRAAAYVVGEDLGTVEPWVREQLAETGVLSYRLWWFEPDRPATWPDRALGAVSTHDLPTVAGAWEGSDLAAQRALGLEPNETGAVAMRDRLREWTGVADTAPVADVVERTYQTLAEAPCSLLTATLDDACEVQERPNFPGTTDGWPNWSLALPLPLEALTARPLALAIAAALSQGNRGRSDRAAPPGF